MKVQKGVVKYKDRSDINCTYGVTDDNVNYYFLEEKELINGSHIASKELKEAIDPMVQASKIGVVDSEGKEIIPFTNRSIKPVNENVLLVEPSEPVSESVKEAVSLKNDPLAATKLVSTNADIRGRLKEKMGGDGRYLFNDQFSEATLYDASGNNLIGNEYYSFISSMNDKLYLSKNTTDCEIAEYSLLPAEVQANNAEQTINVGDVQVSQDVVEGALGAVAGASAEEAPVEAVATEAAVETPVEAAATETTEAQAEETPATYQVAIPTGMEEQQERGAHEVAPIAPPVEDAAPVEATPTEGVEASTTEVATDAAPTETVGTQSEDTNLFMENNGTVESQSIGFSPEDITGDLMGNMIPTVGEAPAQEVQAEAVQGVAEVAEVNTETPMGEISSSEEGMQSTELSDMSGITIPVVQEDTNTEVKAEEEAPLHADVDLESMMAMGGSIVGPGPIAEESHEDIQGEAPAQETQVQAEEAPATEVQAKEEEAPVEEVKQVSAEEVSSMVGEEQPAEVPTAEAPVETVVEEKEEPMTAVEEPKEEVHAEEEVPLSAIFNEPDAKDDFDMDLEMEDDEVFKDALVHTDKIQREDEFDDHYVRDFKDYSRSTVVPGKDTIIVDVAKSMGELMKQNREQKATIAEYANRLEKVSASRKNIAARATHQEKEIDTLTTKLHNSESTITKLESTIQVLENRVHDQERMLDAQAHELEVLRPQIQGKEELVRLLADAKSLLGEESSYDYDSGDSYYRRAA